jgi:hypothetical protein
MNNKITIKDKNGNYLQHVWLQMLSVNHPFGKPEHTVKDEQGNETVIPSEYLVEITDITAQLLLQKESDEARVYLEKTDYLVLKAMESSVPMDEVIKGLRAAARLKVI